MMLTDPFTFARQAAVSESKDSRLINLCKMNVGHELTTCVIIFLNL